MDAWMAWLGQPVLIGDLLDEQAQAVGDPGGDPGGGSFGVGWYGAGRGPRLYRSVVPCAETGLGRPAARVRSPLVLAHHRRASVDLGRVNDCQPLHEGRWLFMHSGEVDGFAGLR